MNLAVSYLWSLHLLLVVADQHIESQKVGVKNVVFDSPVADLVWLSPENRVVLARTHNGMKIPSNCWLFVTCRPFIQEREQRGRMEGYLRWNFGSSASECGVAPFVRVCVNRWYFGEPERQGFGFDLNEQTDSLYE